MSRYLEEGARHTPSDMHTRSGYPIWQLVAVWHARGQSDERVIAEYGLDPLEWAAAKDYYLRHREAIDARRILNDKEPSSPVPGAITVEELLSQAHRIQLGLHHPTTSQQVLTR